MDESMMDLDDDDDDDEVQPPQTQYTQASGRSASRVPSTQQPPQSSIIEDLGDPSDEEDE